MHKLFLLAALIVVCSVTLSSVYLFYPNYCESVGKKSDSPFSCREVVSIQQKGTQGLILSGIQNNQVKNQVYYDMYKGIESRNVFVKEFDDGTFICKTEFITVQGNIKKTNSMILENLDFKKSYTSSDLDFVDFNCISDEKKPEIVILNYKSDKGDFRISFDLLEGRIVDTK